MARAYKTGSEKAKASFRFTSASEERWTLLYMCVVVYVQGSSICLFTYRGARAS